MAVKSVRDVHFEIPLFGLIIPPDLPRRALSSEWGVRVRIREYHLRSHYRDVGVMGDRGRVGPENESSQSAKRIAVPFWLSLRTRWTPRFCRFWLLAPNSIIDCSHRYRPVGMDIPPGWIGATHIIKWADVSRTSSRRPQQYRFVLIHPSQWHYSNPIY